MGAVDVCFDIVRDLFLPKVRDKFALHKADCLAYDFLVVGLEDAIGALCMFLAVSH